jgi:hypothetical protein
VTNGGGVWVGISASALMAFKNGIIDRSNTLSNWRGNDPCGDTWMGVMCSTNSSTNVSRVSELYGFSYFPSTNPMIYTICT